MKNPLFQIVASGIALGIMVGAVAIHALHVAGAEDLGNVDRASGVTSSIFPVSGEPGKGGMFSRKDDSTDEGMATVAVALQKVVDRLEDLQAENSDLRGQLEETNRDLNELQLRTDGLSPQFRPIPSSSSGSVLKPSAGSEFGGVLPPKRP